MGDDGTNDLLVNGILRTNAPQAWFLHEHLVNMPLAIAAPQGPPLNGRAAHR